ncbi:hypothetical protein ZWY2020_052812 [Hordeum vulgare]|nr:hypothetical protein ZWY2020_052812 [Hordeum vulgare]
MDDDLDLDTVAGLASLASPGKGKPRAAWKAAVPKPKKVLTPEQRAKESAKWKDRRHVTDAKDEAIAATAAQQHVTKARVSAATREALYMLVLNPSQHGLVNAVVADAVNTGSSAFPRTVLLDSPRASSCNPVPVFHVYPQASRLSRDCSPEVSVVAPSMPSPAPIDLSTTPVAAGSSVEGARKRARQTPADQLPGAHNLFDDMSTAGDDDYMQNMIFEGGAQALGFDPDETQSQDGQGAFASPIGYNEDQVALIRDQVSLDLDDFPLDHQFPEDYMLEEEDECDIEAEPFFEDEIANQAARMNPKRKIKRTKAYTAAEDKLLCQCWRGISQDPKTGAEQKNSTFWIRVHREFHERKKFPSYQIVSAHRWVSIPKCWRVIQQDRNKFSLEALRVQHNGKCFNLSHRFRVIKDEEKFIVQYAAIKSRGGKKAVEEVGDNDKARPRGKTNAKKEDTRDAASIALIATVEGMIIKKHSREEKRWKEREEHMSAFMEIQRRRLDMEAEKQPRMLEMEAKK